MTKNALTFLPAKLLEGLVTMLTTALYTDLFSTPAYGRFQIINTTVMLIYLASAGWLANAAVRYVGDAKSDDEKKTFFSTAYTCYLVFVAAAAVVGVLCLIISGSPEWPAAALMLCCYALFQIENGMLVQTGRVAASVILSLTAALVRLGGAYFYTSFMPGGVSTPYPAIAAAISADLIAGVCAFAALGAHRSVRFPSFSREKFVSFMRFGLPLVGFSIGVGLLNTADRYLVDLVLGEDRFAVYSANSSVASGLFTLIMAGIMRGVYPAVLGAWRSGGADEAVPLLGKGVRLYLLIAAPAALGMLAVGGRFSEVFFTKTEYHEGIIIGIIACAMFFNGLTEYVNKAWELTAHTRPVFQNSLVAVAVKITVTLALLPVFEIKGAAFGSLVAFFSYFVVSAVRSRKVMPFAIQFKSTVRILIAAFLCCGAAMLTLAVMPYSGGRASGIVSLIAAIFVGGLVYFGVLALTGEIKGEIDSIRARFSNRP